MASETLLRSPPATELLLGALFVLLGLGSWIIVNGVFQALPLVAQTAPEGYDIFSWISIAVAAANVFPLLYLLLLQRCRARTADGAAADGAADDGEGGAGGAVPDAKRIEAIERAATLCVLLGGAIVCLLLALTWQGTSSMLGSSGSHSTPLILLSFAGGGADCMTSVLFYPFAALFPPAYTPALIAGESLTGLLAALAALAQTGGGGGGGEQPLFSVGAFFGGLAVVMLASMAAYVALAFGDTGRRAQASHAERVACDDGAGDGTQMARCNSSSSSSSSSSSMASRRSSKGGAGEVAGGAGGSGPPPPSTRALARACGTACDCWGGLAGRARVAARRLLVAQALLAVVENGVHATLVPHALALYPGKDLMVSVATKAGFGGASLVSALAYWRPLRLGAGDGARWAGLSAAVAACTLWMIVTAGASVAPGSAACGWITTIVTIACKWLVTYLKSCLFLCYHPLGGQVFRYGGIGIQLGSCLGAVLFFLLTVTADVFHD